MQIPDEMEEEFVKGIFVDKGSKENFCQVDPDQSQEYLNRRCKIAEGIVGITREPAELMTWILGVFLSF